MDSRKFLQHCSGLQLTWALVDTTPDRRADFESVLEPLCCHRVCETAKCAMHRVKVHDLAIGEALHARIEIIEISPPTLIMLLSA